MKEVHENLLSFFATSPVVSAKRKNFNASVNLIFLLVLSLGWSQFPFRLIFVSFCFSAQKSRFAIDVKSLIWLLHGPIDLKNFAFCILTICFHRQTRVSSRKSVLGPTSKLNVFLFVSLFPFGKTSWKLSSFISGRAGKYWMNTQKIVVCWSAMDMNVNTDSLLKCILRKISTRFFRHMSNARSREVQPKRVVNFSAPTRIAPVTILLHLTLYLQTFFRWILLPRPSRERFIFAQLRFATHETEREEERILSLLWGFWTVSIEFLMDKENLQKKNCCATKLFAIINSNLRTLVS